jgi:hypothetical protein
VARELKYSSPTMDLDALQREIGSGTVLHDGEAEDEFDPYAPPADEAEDDYDRRRR